MKCSIQSAALLQWIRLAAAVEMVAHSPCLSIALLEVPQVRWLHEAIISTHLHQRHHDQSVQEERASFSFKETLHQTVDGARQHELDLFGLREGGLAELSQEEGRASQQCTPARSHNWRRALPLRLRRR